MIQFYEVTDFASPTGWPTVLVFWRILINRVKKARPLEWRDNGSRLVYVIPRAFDYGIFRLVLFEFFELQDNKFLLVTAIR